MRQEVQELETDYKSLAKDFAELERHTNDVSKELVAFEREDVQMQEKRKHLVTKQKKLKKSISDDGHAKSEAASGAQNYAEDMLKLKAELEKHEVNLAREEAELEKICDGLKDKTAVFSQQIDTRQAELQPWLDKIAEKQAAIDLATNQRDLLEEKSASIQRAIEEAEATMEKVETDNGEKAEQLETLAAEKAELVESVKRLTFELEVSRWSAASCAARMQGPSMCLSYSHPSIPMPLAHSTTTSEAPGGGELNAPEGRRS